MERINVKVEPRLKQELEAEAREKGVRPSDIVFQALAAMRAATPLAASIGPEDRIDRSRGGGST